MFDLDLPSTATDEIDRLGLDLCDLARHLERKFTELVRLQDISTKLSAGLFVGDVLNHIYDSFRSLIPYNRIGFSLLGEDEHHLVARWVRADSDVTRFPVGYVGRIEGSSLAEIFATGQPRILNDLEEHLRANPDSAYTVAALADGIRSSFTCPLISQGKAIGLLFFSSQQANVYEEIHKGLFLQIAGQVSNLIEKSRLYEQLIEVNQRLMTTERELREKATYDSLTGAYNRGFVLGLAEQAMTKAVRESRPLALAMIDADHFKTVNDLHGHLAGDEVLKSVVRVMQSNLRDYDYVGRYGGEEFLILLATPTAEAAREGAERLRAAVEAAKVPFAGREISMTVSVGAVFCDSPQSFELKDILAAADRALYQAKGRGRNCVHLVRL